MTTTGSNASRRRGFTLIEVLLAVAIFAIVLAAINTVFYGALRLRNATTESIERALPIQRTTTIIKRDLEGIVPPGSVLGGELKSGAGSSSGIGLTGLGSMGSQTVQEFYTNSGQIDEVAPWGEAQKVTYYLRDPTNRLTRTGRDLVRAVTRNLLAETQETTSQQWLLGEVERVDYAFYNGTEWRSSWDSSTEETPLPKAVRVSIQLALEDFEREPKPPIELVVPIVVQARTNQPAGGGS